MHQIEEIYSLYDSGFSQSEKAIDRKTVSSYLDKKNYNYTVMDVAALHLPRISKAIRLSSV